MTEILMSIQPQWVEKILDLRKRWELRTTEPKFAPPFKVFIYQTGNGGVVGEFTCDQIDYEFPDDITKEWLKDTCVPLEDAKAYAGSKMLYKWRIRSLIVYKEPRQLSLYGFTRPPQSWCYVKEGETDDKSGDTEGAGQDH